MPGSWKRVRISYAGVRSLLQKRRVAAVVDRERVARQRLRDRARQRRRMHRRRRRLAWPASDVVHRRRACRAAAAASRLVDREAVRRSASTSRMSASARPASACMRDLVQRRRAERRRIDVDVDQPVVRGARADLARPTSRTRSGSRRQGSRRLAAKACAHRIAADDAAVADEMRTVGRHHAERHLGRHHRAPATFAQARATRASAPLTHDAAAGDDQRPPRPPQADLPLPRSSRCADGAARRSRDIAPAPDRTQSSAKSHCADSTSCGMSRCTGPGLPLSASRNARAHQLRHAARDRARPRSIWSAAQNRRAYPGP